MDLAESLARSNPDSLNGVDRWLLRMQFGMDVRKQFYNSLSVLLNNNVLLAKALQTVHSVASDEGRSPKKVVAVVAADVLGRISNGSTFADALSRWVNPEEASIIAAGEAAGRLSGAFNDAIELMIKRGRITAALMAVTLYPGLLGSLVIVILVVVSAFVVPKLSGISDPSTWERFAAVLYVLSRIVTQYGALLAVVCIGVGSWIAWSMPNLIGQARVSLDRLPPWSIYRQMQGATLLLNLAAMLKSGVRLADALDLACDHANPWLRERLAAARNGISMGLNFGESLRASGHAFPDNESIQYLRTLSGLDGFEKGLADYAEFLLEATTKRVELLAKVLMAVALAAVVMFVLMVFGAISDIQAAIEAGLQ